MKRFYLGTHQTDWLGRAGVPLFISCRRLRNRRTFPSAIAPWSLDSGGFTELTMHGRWTTTPQDYAAAVSRYSREIGNLVFAAPQDWMTEPSMLQRTGLSVEDHQLLTRENFLTLRSLEPSLPWLPVLQGQTPADYLRHAAMYSDEGIHLDDFPTVGVGSVCRRQGTREARVIVEALSSQVTPRLHLFGAKTTGLKLYSDLILSSDSLAWSYCARREAPLSGHSHKNCANCIDYALQWRAKVLASTIS